MAEKTMDFEIKDIGGVEHAHLQFQPGVNVLIGPNGAGKTSAINAIRRATGDKLEVEKRDGSDHGEVLSGDDVLLRVGQVARATGKARVSVVDTTPVSILIDPLLKDPDAAARARIKALVDLLDLGVSDEYLEILADGDEALVRATQHIVTEDSIDDLLHASGRMKKHAEGLARAAEGRADESRGEREAHLQRRQEALSELGGEENLVDIAENASRAALVDASRVLERVAAQAEARSELEASQARVREALGDRVRAHVAGMDLDMAEKELAETREAVAEAQAELAKLEERLGGLQAQERRNLETVEDRKRDYASAQKAEELLAKEVSGPTEKEVTEAAAAVEMAEAGVTAATLSKVANFAASEITACDDAIKESDAEAARLRELAQGIPDRLGDVLQKEGAAGLTVSNGRLQTTDGKDFEKRLSEGQRIGRVLDIAAKRYSGLVPLSGTFWAALDPESKKLFAKTCVDKGIFAITEQPGEGALRVEPMTQ